MEAFRMTTSAVAAAGNELGSLAAAVAGAAGAGAVSAATLTPVFGLVGGDYLAELLGAVTAADGEVARLAAFYTSAAAGAVRTAASAVSADAGGAGALLGLVTP